MIKTTRMAHPVLWSMAQDIRMLVEFGKALWFYWQLASACSLGAEKLIGWWRGAGGETLILRAWCQAWTMIKRPRCRCVGSLAFLWQTAPSFFFAPPPCPSTPPSHWEHSSVCVCLFHPQSIPFLTSHMAAAAPDLSHCYPRCLRLLMAQLIMLVSKCLAKGSPGPAATQTQPLCTVRLNYSSHLNAAHDDTIAGPTNWYFIFTRSKDTQPQDFLFTSKPCRDSSPRGTNNIR